MAPPYYPEIEIGGELYYPEPYSIPRLPAGLHHGLVAVGILALLSVASTTCLLVFISLRFVTWRNHYRTFLGYNQYVVLVLNLLLADLQQASGFLISLHWLRRDEILAPTSACFAQGWLIHSGDVGSGLFVLAIAIHTFWTAVYGKRIGNRAFACCVFGIWAFDYMITGIGVGMHGQRYFVRAGAWCWVSSAFENDRLIFHYIWVFIIEFGTILIYIVTFYQLRMKTRQLFQGQAVGVNPPNLATISAVNRITTLMTLYPCVYVLLTLPLSAGRMWSMAHGGRPTSDAFACVAGALLTSCGWVDSLLYTLTRKQLLRDTMPGGSHSSRRTANEAWEANTLGSKGITHTRTVTVEGGQVLDTFPSQSRDGSGSTPSRDGTGVRQVSEAPSFERPPSPTGSTDRILNGGGRSARGGRTKTEISAGLREILDEEDEDSEPASLPSYVAQPSRRS